MCVCTQFLPIMLSFFCSRRKIRYFLSTHSLSLSLSGANSLGQFTERNLLSMKDSLVTSNYVFLFYVIASTFVRTISNSAEIHNC